MANPRHVAILVLLVACAGELPPGGPGPGPGETPDDPPDGEAITATEFMTGLGRVECDDAHACKASFPTDAGITFEEAFGASTSACYPLAAEYYDAAAVQAAITAGRIDFDGVAAAECLAGHAAPTCTTFWDEGPNMPEACFEALVGNVATGGGCAVDFECAGETFCDPATAKCAAAPAEARRAPDGPAMHRVMQALAR